MGATYNPLAKAGFSSTTVQNYDPLLSDGTQVVSRGGIIPGATPVIKRGTICNLNPSTAQVIVAVDAATSNCIMAEDFDATLGAIACLVYVSGKFKADAIIWPAAGDHGSVSDNLRKTHILIESVYGRDGLMVKANPTPESEAAAKERIEKNRADLKEAVKEAGELPLTTAESSLTFLNAEDREKEDTQHLTAPRFEGEDDKDAKVAKDAKEAKDAKDKADKTGEQRHGNPPHHHNPGEEHRK